MIQKVFVLTAAVTTKVAALYPELSERAPLRGRRRTPEPPRGQPQPERQLLATTAYRQPPAGSLRPPRTSQRDGDSGRRAILVPPTKHRLRAHHRSSLPNHRRLPQVALDLGGLSRLRLFLGGLRLHFKNRKAEKQQVTAGYVLGRGEMVMGC